MLDGNSNGCAEVRVSANPLPYPRNTTVPGFGWYENRKSPRNLVFWQARVTPTTLVLQPSGAMMGRPVVDSSRSASR